MPCWTYGIKGENRSFNQNYRSYATNPIPHPISVCVLCALMQEGWILLFNMIHFMGWSQCPCGLQDCFFRLCFNPSDFTYLQRFLPPHRSRVGRDGGRVVLLKAGSCSWTIQRLGGRGEQRKDNMLSVEFILEKISFQEDSA